MVARRLGRGLDGVNCVQDGGSYRLFELFEIQRFRYEDNSQDWNPGLLIQLNTFRRRPRAVGNRFQPGDSGRGRTIITS